MVIDYCGLKIELTQAALEILEGLRKSPTRMRHEKPRLINEVGGLTVENLDKFLVAAAANSNPGIEPVVFPKLEINKIAQENAASQSESVSPPSVKFLTASKPASIERLTASPRRLPGLSIYHTKEGHYAFTAINDIPVVLTNDGNHVSIIPEISSPNYEAIYLTGARSEHSSTDFEIDCGIFINDEYVGYNYCHWLIDWLPRLELLRQGGVNLKRGKIVLARNPTQFQIQTLAYMGIELDDVVVAPHGSSKVANYLGMRQIIATSGGSKDYRHALNGGSAWAAAYLRERLLPKRLHSGQKRIILDRIGNRKLVFDERAQARLDKLGFIRIFAEKIPVDMQIGIFNDAEQIISAHGAGLSNLVFCKPGASVLEIFPENYSTNAYCIISQTVGLVYSCAVATKPENFVAPVAHIRDADLFVANETIDAWLSI